MYFENKTVFLPLKMNTGGKNAFDKQCFFVLRINLKYIFWFMLTAIIKLSMV